LRAQGGFRCFYLGLARISAFQTAKAQTLHESSNKRAGISTLSVCCRDMEKSCGVQSTRRTAAIASLNVGWVLWYQAAGDVRTAVPGVPINPCAQMVIRVEPEQRRGGAQDYQVGPLPLRLLSCDRTGQHLGFNQGPRMPLGEIAGTTVAEITIWLRTNRLTEQSSVGSRLPRGSPPRRSPPGRG
jgi:hypothetical protein